METTAQVSGQAAATAGDDQTSPSDGKVSEVETIFPSEQTEDVLQESTTEETPEPAEPAVPEDLEGKNKRKSDKEWQEMVDKTDKAERITARLQDALSDDEADPEKEPVEILLEKVEVLEAKDKVKDQELARVRWESDNPIVKKEQYKEAWDMVNKEKRYESLTYDEKLMLIRKPEESSITKELMEQTNKQSGSIPSTTGTGSQKPKISPEMQEIATASMVLTPEDLQHYIVDKKVI